MGCTNLYSSELHQVLTVYAATGHFIRYAYLVSTLTAHFVSITDHIVAVQ